VTEKRHQADFCIVGGGLAGLCAALAAARRGTRVVLMQDRPVLGGNASSEVRMWVCGAHGKGNRETGLIEEIELTNIRRNPGKNWSLWDAVLYEKARFEPNITLLLNTTCFECRMDAGQVASVRGVQLTTQTFHTVEATLFADCSGDSVLAPLTGAEFREGREARGEHGESIEPEKADNLRMGSSCLIQARETDRPQPYEPPPWAHDYPREEDLAFRDHDIHDRRTNFWWIEVGGLQDTIKDTEEMRDELLKIAFGVWDHVKNHGNHGAENWALEWVGFLPGKRESRRYVGDHTITQNDVSAGGPFDDVVAYGGWSMDDHHPAGFLHKGEPTIFHPAPSPWGIPYRGLYSRNVANLLFAGRNISASHIALSSSRVMRTCATIGQAVGTAAAIAVGARITPRAVYHERLAELQQALMTDDAWLPGKVRAIGELTRAARLSASCGDPEALRDGVDRALGGVEHAWSGPVAGRGSWVEYRLDAARAVAGMRLVFDSNLMRHYSEMRQRAGSPLDAEPVSVAAELVRRFRIEALTQGGSWAAVHSERDNHQRLVRVRFPEPVRATAFRLVPEETWGSPVSRVLAWDLVEQGDR
jgi:hypothetical protein